MTRSTVNLTITSEGQLPVSHAAGSEFKRPTPPLSEIISVLEKGYPAKEGVTDRADRVQLPVILPYMEEYSRPYFFGWPVTHAWLALFEKCASPYAASVAPGCIGSAVPLLKELSEAARTGADFDLAEETAVHRDAPVQPEDDDEEWPPAEFRFCMVSIRNTAFACDQIFARPTRAQYAWLNAIMPLEPQWFKSFASREQYLELLS
ncbi:hypothetical protein TRAPUB_9932 [Trametes pubescens]|uniref:Uncharacterized protein n=1 Tax=Trametes pubescens TaxID=154538 RepID=A0A1M2W155_TRAPU|nr:hypothetical protein TRAPUB_9932 [Trametes pubescens]